MSDLAISLASLVKNNNGLYKSEKQGKFLLSMSEDGVYTAMGPKIRNSYTLFYHLDDKGVTKVEKYSPTTQKTTVTWERKEEGKTTAQDAKEIRRIKREIASLEKKIAGRQEAWKTGEYTGPEMVDLYHRSMKFDQEILAKYKDLLAKM